MDISANDVKKLRDETGAGVMECKRALQDAMGDFEKAKELLKQQGLARAEKRAGRAASQGLVESYIHAGGRIGALVEVNCETDFVARTPEFRELAHDLAMQVAASSARYVTAEEVPAEESERAAELALLAQPFIKDTSITVGELIKRTVAKVGEAVRVRRIARFELGEGGGAG